MLASSNVNSYSPLANIQANLITQKFDKLTTRCKEVDETPADRFQNNPNVQFVETDQLISKQAFPGGYSQISVLTLPKEGAAIEESYKGFDNAGNHRDDDSHGTIEYTRTIHLPEGPESKTFICNLAQGTLTTIDEKSSVCEDINPPKLDFSQVERSELNAYHDSATQAMVYPDQGFILAGDFSTGN